MHSGILQDSQVKRSFIEASRRAQIIECGIAAIAEFGFAKTSLARIAKGAGISTGVILYHFASKEELIREVVVHVYAAGEAFIRPRIDQSCARRSLHTFIAASVAFIAANPRNVLALMNISDAGGSDNDPRWFDAAVTRPREAGLRNILAAGHASGEFRPFDDRVMVITIIEALDAIPLELSTDPSLDLDAYARELVDLFDRATRADAAPDQPTARSAEPLHKDNGR